MAANEALIIHGDEEIDGDSAMGDMWEDDTTTVRSNLLSPVVEHGRGYHRYRDGVAFYAFPEDTQEQQRLDLQHRLFNLVLEDKLCMAPIEDPLHVLDLGTGTGAWAIDFADKHPASNVCGIDLSVIQPLWVPPNCRFEICDYLLPWDFQHLFNFIFLRRPFASIPDLRPFLCQVWERLSPGGYFEVQDFCPPTSDDNSIPDGGALHAWIEAWCDGLRNKGRDPYLIQQYETMMKDIGFVSVHIVMKKVPQNTWPKDDNFKQLGGWNLVNLLDGMEGLSLRPLIDGGGMAPEDVQQLVDKVKTDLCNRRIHAYWPLYIIHGRKPESSEIL